jgi:DNA polymerase I-like protein with 3'-5' exonuclease and polymerase domains
MQSTGTDLNLFSAMRVQDYWLRTGKDAHIICLVHDAVVAECNEEVRDEIEADLRWFMEDTPRRILKPLINFPVDIHVGRGWGSLKLIEMAETKKPTVTEDKLFVAKTRMSSKV